VLLSSDLPDGLPLPQVEKAVVAVDAPGSGVGFWAGAATACLVAGRYYLAYRLRRPLDDGRGYAVVVASSSDGIMFETLLVLDKEEFGAESLERPALVPLPDGTWRIYVSCATPGSAHWWIDAIDGTDPGKFDPANRMTVLPGDGSSALKDPVVVRHDGRWLLWVCCHPLSDPTRTDRMVTRFGESDDGLEWPSRATALAPQGEGWDARGTRITSVMHRDRCWVAYYDGRANAAENFRERTGIATGSVPSDLRGVGGGPAAQSPWGDNTLRYVDVVALPGGGHRLYYEAGLPDGSHALLTQFVAAN
jgi:hypothetical protein